MEIKNGKQIKTFILNSNNDLDELFILVNQDYQATIDGILLALYNLLLRNYEQNQSRSDYLIVILQSIIEDLDNEQLKYLNLKLNEFNQNITTNVKKKQRIKISNAVNKITNLANLISEKMLSDIKNGKVKLLEYLIFHDKNLYLIEKTLNNNPNYLSYRNKDGEDIFSIVLNRYLSLTETNYDEIDYLYNVIILFLESPNGQVIFNNAPKYQRLIKKTTKNYKEHVIKIIELLDKDFKISLEELEERYDVKFDFPAIIIPEIETFIVDSKGIIDFTYQHCITIDSANATCLDDALYIEKNDDGTHNLYIHIADIPSYIPYNSATDEEARKRIETLYLKDLTILLYPEIISDIKCSLIPNGEKSVITSIYKLDSNCNLISELPKIVKGKITPTYRLNYDEVDNKFKHLSGQELDIMLSQLLMFSINQKKSNPDKELYRKLENFLEFEAHHESLKIDYSPAANIVHETMVLNNYGISKYFKELELPYLYRTLYIPTEDFINEQINKIKSLDEKIRDNLSFRNSLKECYLKANYTSVPNRHKGLNLECYSHSTSPLRRYADTHGQYLIHELIFNRNITDLNIYLWEYRTNELAKYLNQQKIDNEIFLRHYNYLAYKKLIKKK